MSVCFRVLLVVLAWRGASDRAAGALVIVPGDPVGDNDPSFEQGVEVFDVQDVAAHESVCRVADFLAGPTTRISLASGHLRSGQVGKRWANVDAATAPRSTGCIVRATVGFSPTGEVMRRAIRGHPGSGSAWLTRTRSPRVHVISLMRRAAVPTDIRSGTQRATGSARYP